MTFHVIHRFKTDARGSITILGAAMFTGIIGMAALAIEYGLALEQKTEDQRIADLAAYPAATYYIGNTSNSNALSTATSIAKNVAALNGASASNVAVNVGPWANNASVNALSVTISSATPLHLAEVLGFGSLLNVKATSTMQIGSQGSACVVSLSSSSNIDLSTGSGAISAPNCGVATAATLNVGSGANVTAALISYGGAAPTQCSNGKCIVTPVLSNSTVTDPFASNTAIKNAVSAASSLVVSSPTYSAPASPTSISFDLTKGASSQTSGTSPNQCTANADSGKNAAWTITCAAGYTYSFAALKGSAQNVNFTTSGAGTTNFIFPSDPQISGTWTFGAANYYFAQGLSIASTNVTFSGNGTFMFGPAASGSCQSANYSLCITGNSTVAFNGTSNFTLTNGIYLDSKATLTMGSGSNNSYYFGAASDGNVLNLNANSTLTMNDATGSSSVFNVAGSIVNDASACLTIPAAAQHNISGSVDTNGGLILGAGNYSIGGYLSLGQNGSGNYVACGNNKVGIQGTGVSIAVGANVTTSGAQCQNADICFGTGFRYVNLSAPTSGPLTNVLIMGSTHKQVGTTQIYTYFDIDQNANGALNGLIYTPNSPLNMSGGAQIAPPTTTGSCLMVVAQSITMTGSSSLSAAECSNFGATTTASAMRYIQ